MTLVRITENYPDKILKKKKRLRIGKKEILRIVHEKCTGIAEKSQRTFVRVSSKSIQLTSLFLEMILPGNFSWYFF